MNRLSIFAAIVAFVFAFGSGAARADDQTRLAIAHEIVTITHSADAIRAVVPTMMTQLRPLLQKQGASDKMIDDFYTRFNSHMDKELDSFLELAANVYAREFSEDDLNALLAFYKTPAGQDFIAKQPVILKGMMAVGNQWGQNLAKEVLDEFAKEKQDKVENP